MFDRKRVQTTGFLLLLAGLMSASCGSPSRPAADSSVAKPQPDAPTTPALPGLLPVSPGANVLIISFDALRVDGIGAYGDSPSLTPRLDRFAAESVIFDRAYTAAPVTPTSFAAAFTAQLPFRVFRGWRMTGAPTLAEAFQQAGYTTIGVFNNAQLTAERSFGRGFDVYEVFAARTDDQEALDAALEALAEHRDERLFFWLHFNSPHSPYDAREVSSHLYDPAYRGRFETTSTARFTPEDEAEKAQLKRLYDGEIFFVDHLFGQLIDFLDQQGILERSLTVITTDHGEEFGERGTYQHRHLSEETLRVPLLIRPPQGHPLQTVSGVRTDQLYSHVDLWPTLAAAAGLPHDGERDGQNLLAGTPPERPMVSVAMTDPEYRAIGILQRQKKLILTCVPEKSYAFFDLETDPGEVRDLAAEDRSWRPMLETLELIAGDDPCRTIEEALSGVEQTTGLSEETIEGLRALGYVQ